MAVLKMQRISICALKKDRKAILEKLQSLGVLEVDHVLGEDEDFHKMDTVGKKQGFEKAAASVDQALEILEKYAPEDKSLFAALEGKELISAEEGMRVQEERRELLKVAKEIYDLDREHAEQMASIAKLMNSIESLTPWLALDVPLKTMKTERTVFFPGTMPGGTTLEKVYEILCHQVQGTVFEGMVELISGQRFPDIVVGGYYGVEVKTTKSEHWKSTGSSVAEGTRVEGVERIYGEVQQGRVQVVRNRVCHGFGCRTS